MGGFLILVDDLDDMIMDSLNDGTATYLSRTGRVLAEGVPVIVEKDVERFGEGGAVDRVRTRTKCRSATCSRSTAKALSSWTARPGISTASSAMTAT